MKPFSPLYFIRENKAKCILLIFMIFLSYGAYLGGLYVSNPYDNFKLSFDHADKAVTLYLPYVESEEHESLKKDVSEIENVRLLNLGSGQNIYWKTVMGFESGTITNTFKSVNDFRTYCDYMGIECDFDSLTNGSLILSEKFAKNRGLKIGDTVDENFSESLFEEFTLRALTKEDGYMQYYISDESDHSTGYMLIGENGISGKELYNIAYGLRNNHDIYIYDNIREEIREQFETFYMIYTFVIVLMAVILAVTINAAFVGMYQRRNFEFAVYRAIGISRRKIIGKIIGELLCMDMIALAGGGAVFFFGLYLFNNLSLYPNGLYLRYFHPFALFGLMLCNLAVVIPLIITRCRQMMKADICEY